MYYPENGYIEAIEGRNLRKEWRGSILLKSGSTISFDKTKLKEGTGDLTLQCSSSSAIEIGTVYAGVLNLQFKNLNADRYALIDSTITLYIDIIQIGETETVYTIPMGKYIIKESMQTRDSIKITAYDRMILLDKDLPSVMDSNAKSPYAWIATACQTCGVTLGTSRWDLYDMPNGQVTVKFANSNTENKTWRDVVSEAASVLGANAMMDRNGNLAIRRYSPYARDAITSGWRYTSDFSDYQSYYTGIYLSYREGGVQDYQTNASSAAEDTGLSYDLGYNAFLQIDDDTTRRAILKVIIDSQKDLNFAPFTVSAPLNPCYDLMDTLAFYDNQADEENDIAPITTIVYRVGGKMEMRCGGENPALQEVRSRENKAIENIDSGSNAYYSDHFFMEVGSAPASAATLTEGTATKVGELLFNAQEELVTVQIAYTATYVLSADAAVEAEIFMDEDSVYTVSDSQHSGQNTLAVVTGYDFSGKGSHNVSVYLTVTGV